MCPCVQVVIPLSLQKRVEGLLQEHLDRMQLGSDTSNGSAGETKSIDQVEGSTDENVDPFLDESMVEKVLQRRSLRMRNMQRTWQVLFCAFCFDYLLYTRLHDYRQESRSIWEWIYLSVVR